MAQAEDGFGLPFSLSDAEEVAVRTLYQDAQEKNLKMYSVFELAEIVIVSNLNRKEALRRLKNMRKLEDNCKFAELSAKESVEAINGMGSHPGLWASIFPGDEQRDVLLIDPTTSDFNLFAKGESFDRFMHSVVVTSLAMNSDLRKVRRGITFVCNCHPFHANHMHFGVARKYGHAAAGVVPIKIKKLHFMDVSTPARAVMKFVRGLLSILNAKLAKRINITKADRLKEMFTVQNLPTSYGGVAENVDMLRALEERFHMRKEAHSRVECRGVDIEFTGASPSEWHMGRT